MFVQVEIDRMPRVLFSFRWTAGALLSLCCLSTSAMAQDPDVKQLLEQLNSSDSAVQIEAARILSTLGAAARPALPDLVETLGSSDAAVRGAAVLALANASPEDEAAIKALVERLKDDDPEVRAKAAYALGKIGSKDQDALDALIHASLDPEAIVRREVRDALRAIKPPTEVTLPIWAKTLEDAEPQVVIPAMMTLAELGKEAVPALREALRNPSTAYWAALVASEIGPDAAELTPDLVEVIKHDDPECRMQAIVALGQIGEGAKSAVPAIVELLEQETFESVKYAAAFALGEIGDPDVATPELTKLLASEDLGLKAISARSLLKISPDAEIKAKSLKVLLEALKSDDHNIRQLMIRTLAELEAPAEGPRPEVIQAFAEAMQDAKPEVIGEVMSALASKGKAAVPGVIRGLENESTRSYAIRVATLLGPDAEEAVPALLQAWKASQDDPTTQAEIHFALGAIGPAAAPAVPALIAALDSDENLVRNSACYALGRIGPAAQSAVPKLRQLLSATDEFQRLASVWALLKIMPQDRSIQHVAVPLLMGALQDERTEVRVEAIRSLGEIGALAKPAGISLRQALQDEDEHVRNAAKEALEKIGS